MYRGCRPPSPARCCWWGRRCSAGLCCSLGLGARSAANQRDNGSKKWAQLEWPRPRAVAHHVPGKLLLPPAALLLQLLVGPQVLVSIQHVTQIVRAQQAGEEAAVGWTGEVTLEVEQELMRRVFLSETPLPHLILPTLYLYHQVSGWISGQFGELCRQLSEGGTTRRINHPT